MAGMKTVLDPNHMGQSVHPDKANPLPTSHRPSTVGMNKAQADATMAQWRKEVSGATGIPSTDDYWYHQSAGMASNFTGRVSVRGHVGELDSRGAAEYNLQVKQARQPLTDRPPSSPLLGGSEKLSKMAAATGMPPPPTASSPLAGLSHKEKLARMRELRHQLGAP